MLPMAVILVFISQALWNTNTRDERKWHTDSVVASLFRPVGAFIDGASSYVTGRVDKYFFLMDVEEKNATLGHELEKLKLENVFLKEKIRDFQEFKSMATGLALDPERLIPARFLSFDPFHASKTAIIDKGRNQGVSADDVVLVGEGLVGRVLNTFMDSSKVLLLIDPNFSVDAVNRRSGIRILVSGLSDTRLSSGRQPFLTQVEYLENAAEMQEGDPLATSGLGYVFPSGIPIGAVGRVSYSERNLFDKAWVVPAVDFTKLTRVFVLKGAAAEQMKAAKPAPIAQAEKTEETKKPAPRWRKKRRR